MSDRLSPRDSKDRISTSKGVRASRSFECISPATSPRGKHRTSDKSPRRAIESTPIATCPPTSESPPSAGEEGKKKYHTIDLIDPSKPKPSDLVSRRRGVVSVKIHAAHEEDTRRRTERKVGFNTDRIVPPFLVYLVEAIEQSLLTKGLYRVSALEKDISELRSILIEAGGRGGKHVIKVFTPHTIADVFKLYFRELPEPLLTYDVYHDVIHTLGAYDDDEEAYAAKLTVSFKKMPLSNFAIAKFLAKHLRRVAEHSESNLMTPTNLAIVFGPSLLYPKERSMSDALALPRVYSVVQCMLDHFATVFGESATSRRHPWEMNPRRKLRHSVSLKELPFQRSEMLAKENTSNPQAEEKRRFTRVKMPSYHQDVKNLFTESYFGT